jgi:Flp pilus assembly protein TadD
MKTLIDEVRRMVPRWRTTALAARSGELSSAQKPPEAPARNAHGELELSQLAADWNKERSFGTAADLVSAAAVAGRTNAPQGAKEAAEYVLRFGVADRLEALRRAARDVLNRPEPVAWLGFRSKDDRVSGDIQRSRSATRLYARNPLAWVDLARAQVSVGNKEGAQRAIRVAVALAPNHRFVLRSFLRLALHIDDAGNLLLTSEAWDRLRRCADTRRDPWLAAAEVACAMVLGKHSKVAVAGRSLLDLNELSAKSKSELSASLGALEIDAGAERIGKRLLVSALEQPTDNVIAQVAWTDRTLQTELMTPKLLQSELSYEARAWTAFEKGEWTQAISEARAWASDEAFSTRPTHLATFVSSVALGDYEMSIELARRSLRSNPNDTLLRNNLAFSLASAGRAEEAAREFQFIHSARERPEMQVVLIATAGLIAFRLGNKTLGERQYRASIEAAERVHQPQLEVLARLYLAREAALARLPNANAMWTEARSHAAKQPRKEFAALLKVLEAEQKRPLLTRQAVRLTATRRKSRSLLERLWQRFWPFGTKR